jgi:hypothetical protein
MPTFILPKILCSFIDSMVKKRMFAKDLAKKKKKEEKLIIKEHKA